MGEVRILTSEAPIETDGDFIDIKLSSGSILHGVSVFPTQVSVESTGVTSLLFENDEVLAGIIPRDLASSNSIAPQPAVCDSHMPLPQDTTLTLRTFIYNATGSVIIWRVVAIVEVN